MARLFLTCGLLLAALSLSAYGDEKHDHAAPAPPTNAGLEKMKTLVGTWVVADKDGKPTDEVVSVVKLTAGGSAVHETFFPGQPHEMVSLYTAEGPDVMLTHYCMLGNQPQMRATPKAGDKSVAFKFVKATNLKSDNDMCMRNATFTFVDNDTLKSEWSLFQDGKELDKAVFELKRKK